MMIKISGRRTQFASRGSGTSNEWPRRILLGVTLLLCAALLTACGADSGKSAQAAATAQPGLTIDAAALTREPSFVDWDQNGTAMQLIALKDAGGNPRLAFNTCQSCGGSPYAWFEYIGDDTLQCQNCGLTFSTETVGTTKAAGCNPVTITDFSVSGDTVTVPASVLAANADRFSNWKHFE